MFDTVLFFDNSHLRRAVRRRVAQPRGLASPADKERCAVPAVTQASPRNRTDKPLL